MAKHAVLSPSSAKRWMMCPGSVLLSEGLVEESSKFADEGTAAHFLAAHCLERQANAADYLNSLIELCSIGGEHFERFFAPDATNEAEVLSSFFVDADMAENVQVYLDYVRDVVASTNGTLFVEVSVPLEHLTGEEGAQGTSDAVVIADDEIIVIDLKYGRGVEVSAIENEQLMLYALGAAACFQHVGEFQKARMTISQPRVSHQPSEWACDMSTLLEFAWRVEEAASCIARMREKEIPVVYVPTEEACRWCKAKANCPELSAKVQREVGADFDDLLIGPSPVPLIEALDTPSLSAKMACIDLIEGWCAAIRGEVEKRLLRGDEVDGYKLVQGRKGARSWKSAEEVEALLKAMRLKVDQMYDFKLISPTTAEKVLAPTPKRWEKVQAFITQSEGKPSVAPFSDKRPAITVTPVADDFTVV